ncbi:MAG: hypothetical protein PHP32_00385 [Candidatus Izemoplasmatales bacterium]|nr:hypothetical protein [Candidatus Izemoplasmatales bacterium]
MSVFYVVINDGFLKRYYSEKESASPQSPQFIDSLRHAKSFASLDEAQNLLRDKALVNCYIVDQNGMRQSN